MYDFIMIYQLFRQEKFNFCLKLQKHFVVIMPVSPFGFIFYVNFILFYFCIFLTTKKGHTKKNIISLLYLQFFMVEV